MLRDSNEEKEEDERHSGRREEKGRLLGPTSFPSSSHHSRTALPIKGVVHRAFQKWRKKGRSTKGGRKDADSASLETYPWLDIVSWVTADFSSQDVTNEDWNLADIKMDVEALVSDPVSFTETAIAPSIENFEVDHFYADWALALLKQLPTLSQVRYKLVPARVSEDKFWNRFFSTFRRIVIERVHSNPESYLRTSGLLLDGSLPSALSSNPQTSLSAARGLAFRASQADHPSQHFAYDPATSPIGEDRREREMFYFDGQQGRRRSAGVETRAVLDADDDDDARDALSVAANRDARSRAMHSFDIEQGD